MNWTYFLLIGWWLAFFWMGLALVLCCTIIGIPAGMAMLHKTPKIMFAE